MIFQNFQRLHAPCGKKLRNLATGNGNRVQNCLKTLVFEKKTRIFSKNFEKLPVFSKKITGNGNRMLRNLEFGPKIKFSKASPQYFGKKLRNFATGNGNGVQKCLKTMFFEKNTQLLAKSLKFTRFFTPKLEIEGFYCVFK